MKRHDNTKGLFPITATPVAWLRFLHLDARRLWAFLAICAVLVALESLGDDGRLQLRYERELIAQGQWWRLVTAHIVHLGWTHLALNVMGLALMWALFFPDYSPRGWALILACSLVTIDAAFFFIERDVRWYVGLSGLLHGVMAAGTIAYARRREPGAWILVPFLIGKLLYEQLVGTMPYSLDSADGPVVVDAHLYGVLGAVVGVLALRPRRQPL
ncbi:MAG TPA: rhombosortase [Steroidobacteraceae bacterium]|nr:rhombosortase [Steroidobacteraceae bacterium]